MNRNKTPSGFTLIELILVIGLFAFISMLLMTNLFSVYQFKTSLQSKQLLNTEATVLLNNTLPNLIRPGVAINYEASHIQAHEENEKNVKEKVNELSIFTNSSETEYFTLYRTSYEGEAAEKGGVLHAKYSDGKEVSLHSSELLVEDFQVQFPADPRDEGDRSIQPYVTLYLRLRARTPSADDEPINTSYRTTITLRNTSPASYKTPKQS